MKKFAGVLAGIMMMALGGSAMAEQPKPQPKQKMEVVVVKKQEPRRRWVGLLIDAGVPDGAAVGINVHPYFRWMRLNVAGTYNGINGGIRFGGTLAPLDMYSVVSPTATAEWGHSFGGPIPGLNKPIQLEYDYTNLLFGLEFGNKDIWRIYLRGGGAFINMTTSNFGATVGVKDPSIMIGDPHVNVAAIPVAKLGFTYFF